LARADVITLHVPLTDKTRNILSTENLARTKKGVIIVNAARGGVVDEAALLEALKSARVKAAALDVFEKEPPVDFALIDHPGVMASPHIAAAAEEGQKRAGLEVVRILAEKLA
jgi:D-3-phosphoglycerate dehydrogenase